MTTATGFGSSNFGPADNPIYTADFGTVASGIPHSSGNGGMDTLMLTNSLATPGEFTYLLLYDVDQSGSDAIQFTTGTPTFITGIGTTVLAGASGSPLWDSSTLTLSAPLAGTITPNSGGGTNTNANVGVFDITGIGNLKWDDLSGGRQINFAVFTSDTPISLDTSAAVPEPSRAMLLLLAGAGLALRRRR